MDNDALSIAKAINFLQESFKDVQAWNKDNQDALAGLVEKFNAVQSEAREKERMQENAKRNHRRKAEQERKEYRARVIPQWAEENIKPGMIVKVKVKGQGYREVERVTPGQTLSSGYRIDGSLRGQHIDWIRRRDPETKVIRWQLQPGDYITDHTLTNIIGIVTSFDKIGAPVVTSIMDLVEGKKTL